MIFQGTKLISHRAWTWTSDPTLQLQIVITSQEYTLPPLPVSVLHSPTSISWQHILKHLLYLNKALMLKFFVQDLPLEESKLKHSSALCFLLLSISFISDPKKNIQGMVSMWHFQDSSSVSEKSAYTFSSLCGVDIFLWLPGSSHGFYLKNSGLERFNSLHDLPMRNICVLQESSLHSLTSTTQRKKTFHIRIKVKPSSIIANTEAWEFN